MRVPKPLTNVIESFEKLPGIGPKTAQRLSYYLLHVPQSELDNFAESVSNLKKNTVLCSICKNVSEHDPCDICSDSQRDKSQIMVVEQPLDLLAFERAGRYNGVYHVLHGVINPLENIGPDEIFIDQLLTRVKEKNGTKLNDGDVSESNIEVIIATNPTMEGDATAMYISGKLKNQNSDVRTTRLGMGIPTGADLEYADETTLRQAIEGRRQI
jgi:recombination protein RecR